jgi:large subunit ribosomal protein L3
MTSVGIIDDSLSPSKGMDVTLAATVLETPKITIFGARLYKITPYGCKCLGDVISSQGQIASRLGMKKDTKHKDFDWMAKASADACYVTVLAITNPKSAGLPKKKGEVVEIALGGKSCAEQIEFLKPLMGKEVAAKDVLEEGEFVDAISVSKGHGWGGAIERFGVSKQRRKATGRIRHVGTLGPWHPPYVMYTAPQAGQVGFHRRTQYNNRILLIGNDPSKINSPAGFPQYGIVKTDYVLVRGSVPGTQKRFVFLRKGVRSPVAAVRKPQVTYVSVS